MNSAENREDNSPVSYTHLDVYKRQDIAYLQYTSGSTRTPAGVVMSHKNIQVNIEQIVSGYFGEHGGIAPPETTVVSVSYTHLDVYKRQVQ